MTSTSAIQPNQNAEVNTNGVTESGLVAGKRSRGVYARTSQSASKNDSLEPLLPGLSLLSMLPRPTVPAESRVFASCYKA